MQYQCRVEDAKALSPSVFELRFVTDRPLEFKAGQYISVVVPHEGKQLRRPYSIASAPHVKPVELCIQRIAHGPGSTFLAGLRPGDTFDCFAPYGFLLYRPRSDRDAIFIATGTGLAPFRSMALSDEYRATPPRRATCLLGVRTEDEILYGEEMSKVSGMNWVPCLSRVEICPPGACRGRVTQYLADHASEIQWSETEFYLCGNGAMIDEVKSLLKARGVEKTSIHQEIYFKPPSSALPRP